MISHTAHVLLRFVIYRVQKRNIFALAVRDKKKVRKLLEHWRFQQGGWKWQLAEKIRTSNCAEQALICLKKKKGSQVRFMVPVLKDLNIGPYGWRTRTGPF
jgi:hypothetical protein